METAKETSNSADLKILFTRLAGRPLSPPGPNRPAARPPVRRNTGGRKRKRFRF